MAEAHLEPENWSAPDDVPWTLLGLDGLVDAYRAVLAPAMRADGLDPEAGPPSYEWLREHGFRQLIYALREHHDRTVGEFWHGELGVDSGTDGYDWGIDHEPTIAALEGFLDSKRSRGGLSESSIDTLRYRLATYVRAYTKERDTDDLLAPVARDGDVAPHEAVDACWAAFDRIHADFDSGRTKRRIHRVVDGWYAHLLRRKRAAVNPADGLDEEYRWEVSDGDPSRLSADHVRALYDAADAERDRLLVVALCAWGLRSGEVAALHRSNAVLDDDGAEVPYLDFDDRKNGPGQVSLLFGVASLRTRIATLADRPEWNGYLFPSDQSETGHVSTQTVRNRFDALASRASLPDEIDGRKPIPQMGRRFWYDAYSSSLEIVTDGLEAVAAEQGSSSPEVVLRNYLSAERARKLRREHMRERLADAFPSR
ncbi:tyrosine-type recombinase/integrase [Halorussus marinus]|uniref:tyrosine-type recombinase/integrase n=1 Tax=Halorussus marinus TaxID=2505976 RepID=UPI001091E5D7|nr:tyrosine-type recombinase/integrase [Halorussus marinus]